VIGAENFSTSQIQATIFTPGLQFSGARVLTYLLAVDGEPLYRVIFSAEFPADFPPELPRVVLQSEDGARRIQAAPGRLDLIVASQDAARAIDTIESLAWAIAVFRAYTQNMHARVGRLACVMTRTATTDEASSALAQHFCRETLTTQSSALNRPDDFEIRSRTLYWLKADLRVNSWMRCYAGTSFGAIGGPPSDPRKIVMEQDINTLVEAADATEYSDEKIGEFFHMMPGQFDQIMRLYFGEILP